MILPVAAASSARSRFGARRAYLNTSPATFGEWWTDVFAGPAVQTVGRNGRGRPIPSYSFTLNFTLPGHDDDPESYLDALYEAGCDDASIGVGRAGMIGLDFTRSAFSADEALQSAIRGVAQAIPGAALVQAGPDLVGLSEMADLFGFSRQNMRKYATGQASTPAAFPLPTILGDPSLWHLAEIIAWLRANTAIQPSSELCAAAKAAARINFKLERKRLQQILGKPPATRRATAAARTA